MAWPYPGRLAAKNLCYGGVVEKTNGSRTLPLDIVRRSFPDGNIACLRCQLGRMVQETRKHSSHRGSERYEYTFPVTVFHLLGYGSTWSEAEAMIFGPAKPIDIFAGN